MSRAPQQRRIATHARLVDAAKAIVAASSYADMRVEEVVFKAGVAKGTFFSHFRDKDALLEVLIAEDMTAAITAMTQNAPPTDTRAFITVLNPLIAIMGSERIVFDVILRHSGAMAATEIGPIAQHFIDQVVLFAGWIAPQQGKAFRADTDPELLAEGVQAFLFQAIAMSFCAVESRVPMAARMETYLTPWLNAPK